MNTESRKSNILVVGLAALLVMALAGVAYWQSGRPDAVSDKIARQASAIPTVAASSAPVGNAPSQLASLPTNQTLTVRGTKPYVLKSVKPFQKSLRLAAESMGARTVSVLSRNELLIEATPEVRARLAADSRFEEVADFAPSVKIQPELAEIIRSGAAFVDVSLVSLSAEDRELVISCLEQGGGEMLTGCINEGDTIRAKLPATLVAKLAERGDVRWMERFVRPHFVNDLAVGPTTMNVKSVWDNSRGLGLTGAGQAISTSDTGIDTGSTNTMHRDLAKRVKDIQIVGGCYTNDVNGHGTHTAGSIVGDGTMSTNQIRGTAHAADLYAWFCGGKDDSVSTPSTLAGLYVNGGAWTNFIHSASWGSSLKGMYDTQCAENDEYVWKNPEFLPVYSAGNDGYTYGECSICSPAASKNVLAVGATQNARKDPHHEHDGRWGNGDPTKTAAFSSRGPCKDGRTKPDVAAPGVGIVSTRSRFSEYKTYGVYEANTNYAYDSGTSMSCPLTAGAVALVRQWLVEKRHYDGVTEVSEGVTNRLPTSALMKAVIMGGAKGAATPNNDQGWGRVDLADTLAPTNGCGVKLIDRIPFEEGYYTNIVVQTTNDAPLDVQLVWIDYPGSSETVDQSKPRLVNDIDLLVESRVPGQKSVYYGNGGEEPDTLNNAESVHIAKAKASTYVVTIDCKTILHDYKDGGAAALYIRGAFDPEEEVEEPTYVYLKKAEKGFMSLRRALNAIEDQDETVEIYDWVHLDKSVTLTNSCTICATNADASTSYVLRSKEASLTITNATLTLTNVVFTGSEATLVNVLTNGCLKLDAKVDLGVDEYHVAVSTVNANGFELAGALTRRLFMHCDSATKKDGVFGFYSCDQATAANCATNIICADDPDRVTRGRAVDLVPGEKGKFVWQEVGPTDLPLDEASGYFLKEDDRAWKYARLWKGFEAFTNAFARHRTSEFIVRKDGEFELFFTVGTNAVIRGEGALRPVVKAGGASGFWIEEGGSLTVSNLVFTGYCDADTSDEIGFVYVYGGEFILEDGAELNDIRGSAGKMKSGVVDLVSGTVTMRPGSAIVNCTSETGSGGAIYANCRTSCTLNLEGGTITNCHAAVYGGGVYVYNYSLDYSPLVNISGPVTNMFNSSADNLNDDIYLHSDKAVSKFRLMGDVEGKVGVRYGAGAKTGNQEGHAFITNVVGTVSTATFHSFFNDTDTSLMATNNAAGTLLVWTKRPDDGQCAPADAKALLIDADGVTNYYASVERAFAYMGENSPYVIEMLATNRLEGAVSVPEGRDVTLRTAAGRAAALLRKGDYGITIPAGATLTLTNVCISGKGDDRTRSKAFFDVKGGQLEMLSGAMISDVFGFGSRSANAVTVYEGGVFSMRDGALISACTNAYRDVDHIASPGVGGGILVDGQEDGLVKSTAYLRGGTIRDCCARYGRGGAVYVCNKAEVYVSGATRIEQDAFFGNDFVVEDSAQLCLEDAVTGVFNMADGVNGADHDTNYIGRVTWDWASDVEALTNSAAKFVHSVSGDRGTAVTNAEDTLLVWCGAVRGGLLYTNLAGKVYAPVANVSEQANVPPTPEVLPTLSSTASEDDVNAALDASNLSDSSIQANVKTLSEYNDFCEWAKNVAGGKEAVAASGKAYVSYEFGTTALLTNDPTVEITEVASADGGLAVSVVVKDGEDPVAVASAKVKEMFEGTSNVSDWNDKVDLTVSDLTQSTANEVRFTVKPAGNPTKAFIRLTY